MEDYGLSLEEIKINMPEVWLIAIRQFPDLPDEMLVKIINFAYAMFAQDLFVEQVRD